MSDVPQGDGWWQASDGKWYPPEQHPGARPPVVPDVRPTPSGTPPPGTWAGAPGPTNPFSFDMKRWSQAERITAAATVVLFISLFLPWFTYSFGFVSVSVDGLWHGWMYLVLLLCLFIVAYLVARAGFHRMPVTLPLPNDQLLLVATGLNAVLTVLAFLFKPGGLGFTGIGWGVGAFLGLIASLAATAPLAVPALKARRK